MTASEEQRIEFIKQSGGFLAFPIAGAIVWLAVGVMAFFVSTQVSRIALLYGTGMIFPLALLIASITKQKVFQPGNPYAALMGQSVLMVNLLWCIHLVLFIYAPIVMPLSIAVALGLHWIVFGWIIHSSAGLIHSIARTILCTGAFWGFPDHRISAISFSVVACYLYTLITLPKSLNNGE